MNVINSILAVLSKSSEKLTSFINKENAKKMASFISDIESFLRVNDEKYKESMAAIEQMKIEAQKKLDKRREEIELRYSGDIIDLREEEMFRTRLAEIKEKNNNYKVQMMDNLAELESDISALNNDNNNLIIWQEVNMAIELVLVGGSVLSAIWGRNVSEYNMSVNSLAEARKAELEFEKYVKEQEANLKISENNLKSFLKLLSDNKFLLNRYSEMVFEKITNLNIQVEEGLKSIEKFNNIIAKTNNPSERDLYKMLREREIEKCDKNFCNMEKLEQNYIKLVSNLLELALSKEEADKFVKHYNDLVRRNKSISL